MLRSIIRCLVGVAATVALALAAGSGPAQAAPTSYFTAVGVGSPLNPVLFGAAAAPMPDGRVLLTGGSNSLTPGTLPGNWSEVFSPGGNTFAPGPWMAVGRLYHTATVAPDGRIVVAGGFNGTASIDPIEFFSPASGRFSAGGTLSVPRSLHVAAPLPDGRILIAGGVDGTTIRSSAEIFNPKNGTVVPAGNMTTPRMGAVAAPLPDGRILISGGTTAAAPGSPPTDRAEIFDPARGSFSARGLGRMTVPRAFAAASPLPDGRVLVAGGASPGAILTSAEIFNPKTGTFSDAGVGDMTNKRLAFGLAPLPGGRVLVVGGSTGSGANPAEIFVSAPSPIGHGVNFGRQKVGSRSITRSVWVRNAGARKLVPKSARVTGKARRDFRIVGNRCRGRSLGYSEECAVRVSFRPKAKGVRRAAVAFASNATARPVKLRITGRGTGKSGRRGRK